MPIFLVNSFCIRLISILLCLDHPPNVLASIKEYLDTRNRTFMNLDFSPIQNAWTSIQRIPDRYAPPPSLSDIRIHLLDFSLCFLYPICPLYRMPGMPALGRCISLLYRRREARKSCQRHPAKLWIRSTTARASWTRRTHARPCFPFFLMRRRS